MPPPSLLAEGERISEPLPKPVRKDKDGREKKTLNVQVFGRRKARRRAGPTRAAPPPSKPTGPPAWTRRSSESAGDSVK